MPLIPGAEPMQVDGGPLGALVLHGFTGSPVSTRPWGQYLADAGLTVAVPRLPGHGTRWQDLNHTGWQDWYAEAERNLGWLQERCETVVAMGLSNGATLALRLAERHRDLAGLVLLNPHVHSERADRRALPLVSRLVPAVPNTINDIKKPGVDEGAYTRLPLRAASSVTKLWTVVKSEIHAIDQPLLLLRSADDHVVEPSNSAWVLANVSSADKTEVLLENSYHVACLDYDAERIFEASLAFARRVAAPKP